MGIFRGTGGTGDSTTDTTVTTVTEKAAEAASSATSAADSATSAANSASSASTSETNAATSETNAATSATNSATSATNSATSATSASTSATTATTKASEASTSATNAATSATAAQTAQTAAEAAQTAAETAETNAETAEANTLAIFGDAQDVQDAVDDAEKLAINPEDSQYTLSDGTTTGYSALHHAAKAEDHKTAAEVSKNAAETAETAAETAQGLAETAKTAAETAQSAAETAQAAAELAQSNAETVYDDFDDRYLGTKSGDPLVDNDNEGLTTGTLYFNTTENEMRVYTGTAWVAVVDLAGDITVNSLTSNNDVVVKGNLEVQGTTITVDSATAQTIDLGDNDKIRFGDGDDLQVYHDGTDSYIANTTGTLKLSGNTDVTGNITVSGTVDGRDIAADGATLDAVASTYVDVSGDTLTGDLAFGDNVKAIFGASNDLQILHNGTNSQIINNAGTLKIVQNVDDGDVEINADNGSGGTANYFKADSSTGEAILYHYGSEKLATKSSGISVIDLVRINPVDSSSDGLLFENTGGAQVKQYFTGSGATDNFVITRVGTGGSEISLTNTGAVILAHGSTDRLATTSTGIDVTGTVTADGLTVDGTNQIQFNNGKTAYVTGNPSPFIYRTGTSSGSEPFDAFGNLVIQARSNAAADVYVVTGITPAKRLKIEDTGDISFYEDTGTTAKLTWDASAEELQFKDNVKAVFGDGGDFDIKHDGNNTFVVNRTGALTIRNNDDNKDIIIQTDDGSGGFANYFTADGSNGEAILYHYGSEKLATKSTGIDVTGTVTADGLVVKNNGVTSVLLGEASSGDSTIVEIGKGFNAASAIEWHRSSAIDFKIEVATDENASLLYNYADGSNSLNFKRGSTETLVLKADSSGDISFYDDAGTSQDLYWDASTSRLGIGTTSPSQALDVTGNINQEVSGTSTTAFKINADLGTNENRFIQIQTPSTDSAGGAFTFNTGNAYLFQTDSINALEIDAVRDISFYDSTGASKDLYWDASTSRLGLGTTSPSAQLELSSATGSTLRLSRDDTTVVGPNSVGTIEFYTADSDSAGVGASIKGLADGSGGNVALAFSSGTGGSVSEAMRIDSAGKVGIGTTSPSNPLHVYHATTNNVVIFESGDISSEISIKDSTASSFITNEAGKLKLRADVNSEGASSRIQFDVDGSEAARIDSSGNLLVGTTNNTQYAVTDGGDAGLCYRANASLDISRQDGDVTNFNRLGSDGKIVKFRKDGSTIGSIGVDNTDNIFLSGDSSHSGLMAGSSGILPYANGSITNATEDLGQSGINWRNLYLSGGIRADTLAFSSTSGSEYGRFDSSGNFLVGKTSNDNAATAGIELESSGQLNVTVADTFSRFNRLNSDGDILSFRKDNSIVGSIGTNSSDLYLGTGDTGIRFRDGNNDILPFNTSTNANLDNQVSLGGSAVRFKDLYLSGGVYLGGTGSANLLDDYEEGTWTPSLSASTTSDFTLNGGERGVYTKVGNQVTVHGILQISSLGTSSGSMSITGLPFTVVNNLITTSFEASGNISIFANMSSAVSALSLIAVDGTTSALFQKVSGTSATATSSVAVSDVTSSFTIRFTLTYFA